MQHYIGVECPEEMIYADDYNNMKTDPEMKEIFKSKVKKVLGRYRLQQMKMKQRKKQHSED